MVGRHCWALVLLLAASLWTADARPDEDEDEDYYFDWYDYYDDQYNDTYDYYDDDYYDDDDSDYDDSDYDDYDDYDDDDYMDWDDEYTVDHDDKSTEDFDMDETNPMEGDEFNSPVQKLVMQNKTGSMKPEKEAPKMPFIPGETRKVETNLTDSSKKIIGSLARQLMLQQLYVEEMTRSDGGSGLKQIRHQHEGTRNYHSESHTGYAVASIHEHANNIRTVGMGEFIAVLNGVEFRTRHNDYALVKPHSTDKSYHAVEHIEMPDVPPEVTKIKNVAQQIKEMQLWFKAFKDQDYSVRDYRKYFRPVLCYLEGAWHMAKEKIEESFNSDRHFLEASTWFEMQEKIRFTSATGRKNRLENIAYLPTTIIELINGTIPVFAQWNYRILCHPLKGDLPTKNLRIVDDLAARMARQRTLAEHAMSRAARFQVHGYPADEETFHRYSLLDKIMYEVPGKDNYPGVLQDSALDSTTYEFDAATKKRLNAGRYHRWMKVGRKGAFNQFARHRSFADTNLFIALNSQENIAPMKSKSCVWVNRKLKCTPEIQRVSYAIPLEVIYLTPLAKWNPWNIQYKGVYKSPAGKTVYADGRNGGFTKDRAFNGTNDRLFYQTPTEFYSGGAVGSIAADTAKNELGVLDKKGVLRKVCASGARVLIPEIKGVGIVRQRYPIMPIHGEDSSVWKELGALKDMVMQMGKYLKYYREQPPFRKKR